MRNADLTPPVLVLEDEKRKLMEIPISNLRVSGVRIDKPEH
jgi:hypothetical protein